MALVANISPFRKKQRVRSISLSIISRFFTLHSYKAARKMLLIGRKQVKVRDIRVGEGMHLSRFVCLILSKSGVRSVLTASSTGCLHGKANGVQIDLLIERNDGVVSLCEMRYKDEEYELTNTDDKELRMRRNVFLSETGCKKAVQIVFLTPVGLKRNAYYETVQAVVTGGDLFG